MMKLYYQDNYENIKWEDVRLLLQQVGMSYVDVETHRNSFVNSFSVLFVFDNITLIGMGRCISDGVRQSALYDIAVNPEYQGFGLGKKIVSKLMKTTPNCNFILYASSGKEDFYRKLGFKKMKTGMILFADSLRMNNTDFIED